MSSGAQSKIQEHLSEHANVLHKLLNELPQHPAITDTLDYVLGAIYALRQADLIGFRERPAAYVPEYHPHLANYAIELAARKPLDSVWTAGFFFNSGIQRLAAAFDRIPKMLGATTNTAKKRMTEVNRTHCPNWIKVYDEVNSFKHSPEGKAAGGVVSLGDAVGCCSEVLDLLSRKTTTLLQRYQDLKVWKP